MATMTHAHSTEMQECIDNCLRCHSAKSGFRVSPHGPDFDPEHVADKSTQSCGICHFTIPGASSP